MRLRFALASILAALAASACKTGEDNASEAKVAGGVATQGFPELHHFEVDSARGRVCTGVAVSPNTALMAAHCIKASTIDNGVMLPKRDPATDRLLPGEGIRSKKIYAWFALKGVETMDERYAARDIAVVVFPEGTFTSFAPLSRASGLQQEVQVVGYGAAGFDGLSAQVRSSRGVKRAGKNKLSQMRSDLLVVSAIIKDVGPNNAVAASGDSGGPLLDANGGIIGIAAAMYLLNANGQIAPLTTDVDGYKIPVAQGAVKAFNFYADINSPASVRLLRYAVGQGLAVIPGVQGSKEPLDLSDDEWTHESVSGDLGPMVAMCGGGGGGGGDGGFGGGNNTGNNGGFGNTGNNGGFGNTGNNGGFGNTGNKGGIGNTGNNGGFGNTGNNGGFGNAGNNGGFGNTNGNGQFGGPPPGGTGTVGGGNAQRGKTLVQQSCSQAACHSHANYSESALKAQLRNPTLTNASMAAAVNTVMTSPDGQAYANSP